MLPKLIAVSGWKTAGKDTVGHYLMSRYKYQPISFAYELKNMVAKLYPVHRFWLDDQSKKEMPLLNMPVIATDPFSKVIHEMLADELKSGYWTPRALCILEGSVKRSVYANYWVKKVLEHVIQDEHHNYVITDMRYCNEADVTKLMIPSANILRVERAGLKITTLDPSERDLDNYRFDRVLRNDGTIEDLHKEVDKYMQEII